MSHKSKSSYMVDLKSTQEVKIPHFILGGNKFIRHNCVLSDVINQFLRKLPAMDTPVIFPPMILPLLFGTPQRHGRPEATEIEMYIVAVNHVLIQDSGFG